MSENNEASNESNGREDNTLQPSRLSSARNNLHRTGVLRPSVLGSALTNKTLWKNNVESGNYTKSKDDVVANPFLKEQDDDEFISDDECTSTNERVEAETKSTSDNKLKEQDKSQKYDDEDDHDERPDPISLLRKNGLERSNLFAAAKSSIPRVEKSGFIFGQNVHERVVVDNLAGIDSSNNKSDNLEKSSSNETGELLFSSVAAKSHENEGIVTSGTSGQECTENKSLNDVAREYEESRAQKRKYEEVKTFTGEENEKNIDEISCKLFAFVNSNWEERGRGSLRLNDSKDEKECSRVVFRQSGNLRVLLNTKVWAGMVAERPSQKSLRLTAIDNSGKIKIFLLMARPTEISLLYSNLVARIEARKASHPEEAIQDCEHEENKKNGDRADDAVAAAEAAEDASVEKETTLSTENIESEVVETDEPSAKKVITTETSN